MKQLALTAAAAALFWAAPSHATLMIAADVDGSTFTCSDNQAGCDLNANIGVLTLGPTVIGGVLFEGSSQFQTVGPPTNALLTNSVQITNNTGGTANIQFAVGGTSFASPTETFSAAGSGTWLNAAGSTIDLAWYGDTGNTQGAESVTDLPGVLLASDSFIAGAGASAFSTGTITGPWVTTSPFSWTMYAEGDLVSGATATLAGRSQDITADVTAVPEPASLALLSSMLLGMGWLIRRRKHS